MTTKQTLCRTFAAIVAMLLTLPAYMWADSTFGGGSGTITDPYKIENPQHLRQLAAEVNDGNRFEDTYFKLTMSFSCWIEPFTPIGGKYYNTSDGGTGIRQFCGDFNGNGKTIYDLNINPQGDFYSVGLFGELGYGAHIHDLTIDSSNTGSTIMGWGNCGAIAGSVNSDAVIYNCHVKEGVVVSADPDNYTSSSSDFGGIAGESAGIINGCTSKATVTDAGCDLKRLGGIAGYNIYRIIDCLSFATIVGTNEVGGIAGNGDTGQDYCDNFFHSPTPMGGVNGADVSGATWIGTISFDGGFSTDILSPPMYTDNGVDYFAADSKCSLSNDIVGNDGFILVDPQLTSEQVTLNNDVLNGVQVKSFIFPHGQDVVIGCSYSALKRDIAYTTWVNIDIPEQEYTGEALSPVITITDNMTGELVTLTENVDYTVILPNEEMVDVGQYTITIVGIGDFAGTTTAIFTITQRGWLGEGTEENPYQINSVNDMLVLANETMSNDFTDTYFILMNNLDFTGIEYKMVGADSDYMFNGHFDGNGKIIDNVTLDGTNNKSGLFGWIGSGAVIKNLISGDGNVFNDLMCAGGIVGRMEGAVIDGCTSYATVSVTSKSTFSGRYAGGIAGDATGGIITNCINYGNVTAKRGAGGITGYATYASLSNNINFGQTIAGEKSGGIVGLNSYATISNNYYAGECSTGGIDGNDVAGEAMRGYAISGDDEVEIELIDDSTVGIAVEGMAYAGNEQQIILKLSRKNSDTHGASPLKASSSTKFVASNGELVDNNDGTWTLTMTDENVSISIDNTTSIIVGINNGKHGDGTRYNLMGQPVGNDYKGIVIENGKKILVK